MDGSGWEGVYNALTKDGYTVTIVQNPTISLEDDVAVTKRAIATQNGPVILVGHSYGGAVITQAGNDPKVAGLVYITAFALDKGESVSSLIKDPPPGAPVPPILPPVDGFLLLDKAKFPASFAGDVSPEKAAFMAASQVPWGLNALGGTVSEPAWRTKPSWYLVTTEDKMIPPDAQRAMSKRAGSTVVEVKGSHAIYVSQPQAVALFIEKAAKGALGGRERTSRSESFDRCKIGVRVVALRPGGGFGGAGRTDEASAFPQGPRANSGKEVLRSSLVAPGLLISVDNCPTHLLSEDSAGETLVLYRKRADEKSVGRREGDNGALSIKPFERSRVTTLWDLNWVFCVGWEGGAREGRVGGVAKRGERGDGSVDGPRSKAMEGQ